MTLSLDPAFSSIVERRARIVMMILWFVSYSEEKSIICDRGYVIQLSVSSKYLTLRITVLPDRGKAA